MSRSVPPPSERRSSRYLVLPAVLVLIALGVSLFLFQQSPDAEIVRDGDLCPEDQGQIAAGAALVVDLTKPFDRAGTPFAGSLLREITLDVVRDTELQVFTLNDSSGAPRTLVGRLCKPYDNSDLNIKQAKDDLGSTRDCDDLPAQLSSGIRQSATAFCAARSALAGDLSALFQRPRPAAEPVANAYLVEAFEDIRLDAAQRGIPHTLYVFSDMMQHARWYSHLDIEWMNWSHDAFHELLEQRSWYFAPTPDAPERRVEILYVPRFNLTDQSRAQRLHKEFWRRYFEGAEVRFRNWPSMPAYAAAPLMNILTESEIATNERAAAEQLLLEVQREKQELERQRQELERLAQAEAERPQEPEPAPAEIPVALPEAQAQAPAGPEPIEPVAAEVADVAEVPSAGDLANVPAEADGTEPSADTAQGGETEEPSLAETSAAPPLAEVPLGDESVAADRPDGGLPAEPAGAADAPAAETASRPSEEPTPAPDPPASPAPAAVPDSVPSDSPSDLAAAGPAETPPCPMEVEGGVENLSGLNRVNSLVNLGDATMVVSYRVNESGDTLDDEVRVIDEESEATNPREYRYIASQVLRAVRRMRVYFNDPGDGSCVRSQSARMTLRFQGADNAARGRSPF